MGNRSSYRLTVWNRPRMAKHCDPCENTDRIDVDIIVIPPGTMGMLLHIPAVSDSRGSSLPVAIVLLTLLAIMGAAIMEVSRFGDLAARAQLSAAAAMHLADAGLAAYERGAVPTVGTVRLESASGEATVTASQMIRMSDSTIMVLVESRGTAPAGVRPIGQRTLQVMMHIDTTGVRQRIVGTLAEEY